MSEASAQRDGRAPRELDGQLLAVGGFVIGSAWLFSLASELKGNMWEPQGLIVRQWLALGILIVPYVALYSVTHVGVERLGRWVMRWSWMRALVAALKASGRLAVWLGPLPFIGFGVVLIAIASVFAVPTTVSRILTWLAILLLFAFEAIGLRRREALGRVVRNSLPFVKRHGWHAFRLTTHALMVAAFLACAAWLVLDDNRRIAVLLGTLQTLAFLRLSHSKSIGFVRIASIVSVSIGAWAFTLGFMFTPLEQWLLAAVESTGFAPAAFVCAFTLVLIEFGSIESTPARRRRLRAVALLIAVGAFVELGLRTDNLLSDWLPYHRTFWVAPAQFIRNGGWPLWDFPSQYGVLSELSIALWPSHSTWQALYLETALFLGVVATAIFVLLRYRREGLANAVFALVATCAIVYSAQGARYPAGWRLYPQLGLRFQWVIAVIAIAFVIHCNRANTKRRVLAYVGGYLVWAVSLAWSFESGVFTSCAWLAFVASDCVVDLFARGEHRVRRLLTAALPVLAIPTAMIALTECIFRVMRGHGPDWSSYVEFSAAYQREGSGILQEAPNVHGALWMIALALIAVASIGVAVVRQRRYHCLPLVAACWFGFWGTSIYFVGETIEVHASGLAPVIAMVVATLFALQRFEGGPVFVTLPVRAALTPFFALLIAYAFGEARHIAAIRAPFTPGFTLDSTADFPPISGELAQLFARAGVKPNDRVILPIPFLANKIGIGLTLPFVRGRDGRLIEQTAWLPLSPIGAFNSLFTLSYERRQTYLRRYYSDVRETGWFASYHRNADCAMLIPGLLNVRVARSANYEIALCSGLPQPALGAMTGASPMLQQRTETRR